jgi:hypothetical protein
VPRDSNPPTAGRIEEQPYVSRYLEDLDRRNTDVRHWLFSSGCSVYRVHWTWSLFVGQIRSDCYPLWFLSASFPAWSLNRRTIGGPGLMGRFALVDTINWSVIHVFSIKYSQVQVWCGCYSNHAFEPSKIESISASMTSRNPGPYPPPRFGFHPKEGPLLALDCAVGKSVCVSRAT